MTYNGRRESGVDETGIVVSLALEEACYVGERESGPTLDTAPGALVGSILGGFQLTSLLGTGGMAEVYRGHDPQLNRDVAVKVLTSQAAQDSQYVARFRSEAKRTAGLRHPNIVPVFHYGEEHGLLYLVMPVLKESLRDRMQREGVLDPVEAVFLTVQIAMALDAAHQQGLVHRDVKPENILLNDEGLPLLTDFGIARELEMLRDATAARTLGSLGLPIGTPQYMAPEQLRGAVADQRVDVYGLGTVLYEMLTGRVPYDGGTPFEVVARVLTETPLPPTDYNPAIWPELANVVLGAVAPDSERRYPNMSSLAEALRQAVLAWTPGASGGSMNGFSGGVPISTHLVPVPARIPALARRRPHSLLMIVIAAIIVLALGASGAGGVLLAMHAKAPATTGTRSATAPATSAPTAGPGALPTATAENASTVASIGGGQPTVAPAAPVPTAVPTPTATPLLTPTIVVSSSPLQATPSTTPKNCFATQKLTNISSVDAHWSWSNTPPTGGGWQYSTVSLTTGYSGTPPTITTPPQSSIYVYIKAPLTDLSCTEYNNVVATITVTGGNGTQFSVKY